MWRRDALVATRTPIREQNAEVGTVYDAVDVEVARDRRSGAGCWAPVGKQYAKVAAVNGAVDVDVADAFAGVRDTVIVGIRELSDPDLAVVDDAIVVAVGGPLKE